MNLRNKYMQDAMQILKEKKQKNAVLEKERSETIRKHLPEALHLRQNLAERMKDFYLQTLERPEKKEEFLSELRKLQQETDEKVESLLTENGYPANYLEPIFDCPACEDSGFLKNQSVCSCLNREFIARAYQKSNLRDILERENFNNFKLELYPDTMNEQYRINPRENMKDVYQNCYHFAKTFGNHENNLLLYGPSGLGKTFLCSSIAKEVMDAGFSVIYLSAPEFFGIFEKYHFHHNDDSVDHNYIESLFDCDLLILDDLGTEVISVVSQQDLFQTLNRRINEKKSTVISTNLSLSQISKTYSERIASRILGEYTPLLFFGDDIRKKRYL